jgi:hypothetical protein
MKRIITFTVLVLLINSALTQETTESKYHPNALRFQFLGPIKGVLGLEYERFFGKQFAFVAEAGILGFNETSNVAENANGGLFGVGFKVYGPNYAISNRQKKNQSISTGFYGIGRIAFESFTGQQTFFSYSFVEPSEERIVEFSKSSGTVMLGGGFNLHVLKYVSIDSGLAFGYVVADDSKITSNPFNISTNVTSRLHHGARFGSGTPFVARLWVNIGVNF